MQRYFSNIYWHFTGSNPHRTGQITKPGDMGKPKTPEEAVRIVEEILEARTLLAKATERIAGELATEEFCCLTDIPFKDLQGHAIYYGTVALGFRASVVHDRFVPVLYIPHKNIPVTQLLESWRRAVEAEEKTDDLDARLEELQGFFLNFVKLTDFSISLDKTFYREREWRHIGDFRFAKEDVEAVIAPREFLPRLQRRLFHELAYPETISLIAWEFIERS
jgi:hypothetical protein